MERHEYFENEATSRGDLLGFITSPRTGSAKLKQDYDSAALIFGRAFHEYMEGTFDNDYFVFDDSAKVKELEEAGAKTARNTNKYRDWKSDFFDANLGKVLISNEDYEKIVKMCNNIYDTNFYRELFLAKEPVNISYEKAYYATIDGKKFKALADVAIDRGDNILIVDWKKTRKKLNPSNPMAISYIIKEWRLDFQQVHYKKIIEAATGKEVTFVFVFAEDHTGHEVLPVIIKEDSDLILQSELDWDIANDNHNKYLAGSTAGIDSILENNILIIE